MVRVVVDDGEMDWWRAGGWRDFGSMMMHGSAVSGFWQMHRGRGGGSSGRRDGGAQRWPQSPYRTLTARNSAGFHPVTVLGFALSTRGYLNWQRSQGAISSLTPPLKTPWEWKEPQAFFIEWGRPRPFRPRLGSVGVSHRYWYRLCFGSGLREGQEEV